VDMNIFVDIHGRSVDMDMDGKFHIHGKPGFDYIPKWFTCRQIVNQTVTHPSNNHLIASRLGVELRTSRSQVQRSRLLLGRTT